MVGLSTPSTSIISQNLTFRAGETFSSRDWFNFYFRFLSKIFKDSVIFVKMLSEQ